VRRAVWTGAELLSKRLWAAAKRLSKEVVGRLWAARSVRPQAVHNLPAVASRSSVICWFGLSMRCFLGFFSLGSDAVGAAVALSLDFYLVCVMRQTV